MFGLELLSKLFMILLEMLVFYCAPVTRPIPVDRISRQGLFSVLSSTNVLVYMGLRPSAFNLLPVASALLNLLVTGCTYR